MAESFAEEFKALRRIKEINQDTLALRAGLGTRTIGRWETGQRLPRIPELEAALTALRATAQERLRLLSHITAARGQRAAASPAAESAGAWADSGDLLRAIRMRQGMTQEQAAVKIGVRRATILDWEKGNHALSGELLEEFCAAFGVFPEEKEALRSGHLLLADGRREWTLEQCEAQTVALHKAANFGGSSLIDLQALTLRRQLRMQTAYPKKVLRLQISVKLYHAYWLQLHNRKVESETAMRSAMTCMRGEGKPSLDWAGVLNMASSRTTRRMGYARGSLVVYRKWVAYLPETEFRLFPLCDAAWYTAAGGDTATAWSLLAEAERLLSGQVQQQAEAERCIRKTRATIEMRTRLSTAALQRLLDDCGTVQNRIRYHTLWIEALWDQGETREATKAFAALEKQYRDALPPYYRQICTDILS